MSKNSKTRSDDAPEEDFPPLGRPAPRPNAPSQAAGQGAVQAVKPPSQGQWRKEALAPRAAAGGGGADRGAGSTGSGAVARFDENALRVARSFYDSHRQRIRRIATLTELMTYFLEHANTSCDFSKVLNALAKDGLNVVVVYAEDGVKKLRWKSFPLHDLLFKGPATLEDVAAELNRDPQQAQIAGKKGWGCLHLAAYPAPPGSKKLDDVVLSIVRLLVERGADRDAVDDDGRRAVCFAAQAGLVSTTQFLMQSAAYPDAIRSISACTPAGLNLMHYAAVSCSVQLVDHLMSPAFFPRHATGIAQLSKVLSAETKGGVDIPAHYAARSGNQDVLAALERQGSPLERRNKIGRTPREILPLPTIDDVVTEEPQPQRQPDDPSGALPAILHDSRPFPEVAYKMYPSRIKRRHAAGAHAEDDFAKRSDVQIHEQFHRRHSVFDCDETLVLWSRAGSDHLQKSVVYTKDFTNRSARPDHGLASSPSVFSNSSEQFYQRLHRIISMNAALFVPYEFYSDVDMTHEDDVDCTYSCFFAVEQEYSDMHSLDDLLVLAEDGSTSRPCFPETAMQYIASTILKALALLYQDSALCPNLPGENGVFEYNLLNPSTIMCSSDGCVKLAAPMFPPSSDQPNEFSSSRANVVRVGAACDSDRVYSPPDARAVAKDAWALAVTLIELRTGRPFKFHAPLETIKAKLTVESHVGPDDSSSALWLEVMQSVQMAGRESEIFMQFLQALIHLPPSMPQSIVSLQNHPWLIARKEPLPNLSGWFQDVSIQIRPWLDRKSLLSYVENRFCSRYDAHISKFDGELVMGNVCNIGDVNCEAWRDASLPLVPPEIIKLAEQSASFYPVFSFLQDISAFGHEPLSIVRIMMVGIGEVGKTRLVDALGSREGRSLKPISSQNRTVAAEVSEFKLEGAAGASAQSRALTACVWDFAGQVEYYMTHSLFMSERAIYMLVWKRPDQQRDCMTDVERNGIAMWLQMLAASVPNAKIVVVGTHRETPRADESPKEYLARYELLAGEVRQFVRGQCDSINAIINKKKKSDSITGMALVHFADVDSCTGFGVADLKLKLHTLALTMPFVDIEIPSSYNVIEHCIRHLNGDNDDDDSDEDGGGDDGDDGDFKTILSRTEFLELFRKFQNRMLIKKYKKKVKEDRMKRTEISEASPTASPSETKQILPQFGDPQLEDDDGFETPASDAVAPSRSVFAPQPLQAQASEPDTDVTQQAAHSTASPHAANAAEIPEQLQAQGPEQVQVYGPDLSDAAVPPKLTPLADVQPDEEERIEGAMLLDEDIWKGVEFWNLLGIVYVQKGSNFVIIRPQRILDFLKPLVHREPEMMLQANWRSDPNNDLLDNEVVMRCSSDDRFKLCVRKTLARLRIEGLILASELKWFRFWSSLSQEKLDFMLEFLQNHHVLQRSAHDDNQLHVISRVHFKEISTSQCLEFCGPYQAFYIINEMHIDFLARVQSFLLARQRFATIDVSSCRSADIAATRFSQGARSGEVRMQPIRTETGEIKRLFGPIAESVAADYSFMIVVCATDFGFFALGVQCAELFLSAHSNQVRSLSAASSCTDTDSVCVCCWLKNGSETVFEVDPQKHRLSRYFRPQGSVQEGEPCLTYPIAEAFAANSEFSRQPFCKLWARVSEFCILHCHSETDGTCFFKKNFFELLDKVCACSSSILDQNNAISQELIDCFAGGPKGTRAVVVLLSPAFLCSPNCVAMLQVALHHCSHAFVIPLHPSVAHFSREALLQSKTVCNGYSQADGNPQFFKLSDQCISCLKLLHQQEKSNARHYDHWLKLRPWASDFSPQWSSCGAGIAVSDSNNDTVAMFAPVGSLNSKHLCCMNSLCRELLALLTCPAPARSSKELSMPSAGAALRVARPAFERSLRVFSKGNTCHSAHLLKFLNELMALGLTDEDIIQSCESVQNSVVSGDEQHQFFIQNPFGYFAAPFVPGPCFFADAFRQIANKMNIGLDEISCLPLDILSERFESSSGASAASTRSLSTDSLSSLESLSSRSNSGSTQNVKSNANLCAIKSNSMSLFKSQYPIFANELGIMAKIEETLAPLDEASLFSLTAQQLPLQESCGLAFVRCVGEIRLRVRAHPVLIEGRVHDVLTKWGMTLVGELGSGGFGRVFSCSAQPSLQYGNETRFAVKVINSDRQSFFENEVLALRKLGHPNIVPMHHVHCPVAPNAGDDSSPDVAAYSMPLLPGDLRNVIEGSADCPFRGHLSQDAFFSIAQQLLSTLKFVHDNDFFHGDIKPENILWKLRVNQGSNADYVFENIHILLSDFGLVKTRVAPASSIGVFEPNAGPGQGSLYYLSPEQQVNGGVYTAADDTWSAALVLAELLCRTSIRKARGTVDLKFLYQNCPAHLSRFVPAVFAALQENLYLRVVTPDALLRCIKASDRFYDVAVLFQPNSQNTDVGIADYLRLLLDQKGYRAFTCKIGQTLCSECDNILHRTVEYLGPCFEEVFKSLYVQVMSAMKSFVFEQCGGAVPPSTGSSFDPNNFLHQQFKIRIEEKIVKDQRCHCSIAFNTDMDILVRELDRICRCGSANFDDAAWVQSNASSSPAFACALQLAKACTGKIDRFAESGRSRDSFQVLDFQARCKICMNLSLFPQNVQIAASRLVEVRNAFLGHKTSPDFSLQEYCEIMDCIDNFGAAFGRSLPQFGRRTPSEILKECEVQSICQSSVAVPILSDQVLSSWTKKPSQNHHKEIDVLLTQCNAVVNCLNSWCSSAPHPYPTHRGSSLREAMPVFVKQSKAEHDLCDKFQEDELRSMCKGCIDNPYQPGLGVENVLSFFTSESSIASCRLYTGSSPESRQRMCRHIEASLRRRPGARFQNQPYFCVAVCNNSKKKAVQRVCSSPKSECKIDVVELHVVKIRGAELEPGQYLKHGEYCIGQIMKIAHIGHDESSSRPKYRLTVSCIRIFSLMEGDQLFPVFCSEEEFQKGESEATKASADNTYSLSKQREQNIRLLEANIRELGDADCNKENKKFATSLLKKLQKKNPKMLSATEEKYLAEIRLQTGALDVKDCPTLSQPLLEQPQVKLATPAAAPRGSSAAAGGGGGAVSSGLAAEPTLLQGSVISATTAPTDRVPPPADDLFQALDRQQLMQHWPSIHRALGVRTLAELLELHVDAAVQELQQTLPLLQRQRLRSLFDKQ